MSPFLFSGGLQLAGSLLGGLSRKKTAKKVWNKLTDLQTRAEDSATQGIYVRQQDQARAIAQRDADQRAMDARGAAGIDLIKLRRDARAAGFNPLTVLQATGGAGYQGPEFLTTPFIGYADDFFTKADIIVGSMGAIQGAGQARVETAGYFGDAIAGLGDALMNWQKDAMERQHELNLQQLQEVGRVTQRASNSALSAFGAPARKITAGNAFIGPPNPFESTPVYLPDRTPILVSKAAADIRGWKPGHWMEPGDLEDIMGEAGQLASFDQALPWYYRDYFGAGKDTPFEPSGTTPATGYKPPAGEWGLPLGFGTAAPVTKW